MKLERLIAIIMLLLQRPRISAQALAEMFEVSLRTIYRDMETINRAGVPVVSTPGVGGGFHILEQYKIDKKLFTSAELATILTGLDALASSLGDENIRNALAKIRSCIPAALEDEVSLRMEQVIIDLRPWLGQRRLPALLEIIKVALRESRMLTFAYADRKGVPSQRSVEPCRLILKGTHWYVQAYCLDRQDFRLFRLSRMTDVVLLEEGFCPRPCPNPLREYVNTMHHHETRVLLRIQATLRDRVLEFCDSKDLIADGPDHYIVRFPFMADEFGYGMLLGLGVGCQCLSPPEVREELRHRLSVMLHEYVMGEAMNTHTSNY